jgi:hypothetical protein
MFLAAVAISVDLWRIHPALAGIFVASVTIGTWIKLRGYDDEDPEEES